MSLAKAKTAPSVSGNDTQAWLQIVAEKIRGLRFGAIHIKVHESHVVLIERIDQERFEIISKERRDGA